MDPPSIVKLLEDDEDWQDETEGSRREVEAFQAALSRDIGSDAAATFQTSGSNPGSLMEAARQSGNIDSQVQSSQQEQNSSEIQVKKEPLNVEKQIYNKVLTAPQMKPQEKHKYEAAADKDPNQISQVTGVPVSESNPPLNNEPDRMFNRDSESQFLKLQKMSNQQATILDRTSNQNNRGGGKQVPFAVLLPELLPQLDKDRGMQLQTLFNRLKKNEIIKDDFVRLMRSVVGDQMLRLAVSKVHFQSATSHFQQTPPASQQLPPRMAPISAGATNLTDRQSFAQLHQKGANSSAISNHHLSAAQGQPNTGYVKKENSEESSQEVGRQSTGNPLSSSTSGANQGTRREQSSATIQGLEKPLQQQIPFQQKAFSMYGTGSNASNYHPSSGSSITTSTSSFKSPSQELQMRQVPQHRSISAQLGGSLSGMNMGDQGSGKTGPVKDDSSEKQSSKMGFTTAHGGPSTSGNAFPASTVSPNITTQVDSNAMLDSRNPSITVPSGVNRTPPKKPSVGQKKPLETVGASPPSSSKKQKLAGAFSDQSIEHLNDVTAVSGVNIREEEEQLFSGVKDDLRVSEASRRVVQEEEERLILQKTPLQKKLSEIMVKCGLKGISNDVERCLSLCVEERMRGLVTNLIRLSKQRVDVEMPRHKTVITSDVRHRIMMMNWKAKEEWEKKKAEVEKLRKLNEPEDANGSAADKEKDDGRTKSVKVNRDQDDKMRTTAANVAARAAVGGDDMLSKWQLMAEQARQKREGGTDGHGASSSSQHVKDVARKPTSNLGRNANDTQEVEKKGNGIPVSPFGEYGPTRKIGRNQVMAPQPRVARSICVKDVIAVLEREPQMSKSTMLYRLYEKIRSEGNAD